MTKPAKLALGIGLAALVFARAAAATIGLARFAFAWVALSCAIASFAYAWNRPDLFGKRGGRLARVNALLLLPYLLAFRIACRIMRDWRRTPALSSVQPGLWVGGRIGAQLQALGIRTVWDLTSMDAQVVRQRWSVVLERTVQELRGVPCLGLDDVPPPKQQIACTRSFGSAVRELAPLTEAVAEFATRAAEKLRQQGSLAGEVLVFIRTSPFRPVPQYSRSHVQPLVTPTDDTRRIVGAALEGLKKIHRRGFDYAKAGVMLMDLGSASQVQAELGFDAAEGQGGAVPGERNDPHDGPAAPPRDPQRLMAALDAVNQRWGRHTMKLGANRVGEAPRGWIMKQERRTPRYTTQWEEMPLVRA